MRVIAEIEADDLAEQLNQDQAMQLIKELDAWQADYEFTLRLAKHFVAELKKESTPEEPFSFHDLE